MEIKDFEKCIDIIGLNMELELKYVSLGSTTGSTVKKAMAIKKDDDYVTVYYWDVSGNCVTENFNTSDDETVEKLIEVLWMFPQLLYHSTKVLNFDMQVLERKYFAK